VEPDAWDVPNSGSIVSNGLGLEPKAGGHLYLLQGNVNWVNGGVILADYVHEIRPGTYTLTLDVGLGEGSAFTGDDEQRLAVGFFDPEADLSQSGLRDAINTFLASEGVTVERLATDVPEAGEWQEWKLAITVAPDSPVVGMNHRLGMAVNTGKETERRSILFDRVKLEHEPAAN
jgi:hypothetical protein